MKKYLKKYFIDALSAMSYGLFATLLIGTIFDTIGNYTGFEFLNEVAAFAKAASGMAIGVAVSNALNASPLVMLSCAVVGNCGYSLGANDLSFTAGPAGAFVACLVATEIGMLVSKKTKVDILVTPTVTILSGYLVSKFTCSYIAQSMNLLGNFINTATEMQPILMGIIISVVVGMILTLPISSAAICSIIGIAGIAGGAAAVGCCCQMVGFAVMSYKENKFSGLISQGLGTSMLQMSNICKNPLIWIPPTLSAAICGPLATTIFSLKCEGVSAGMGTCGLVGPIGIISVTNNDTKMWLGIILLCFVLPAVLSTFFTTIFKKLNWIKKNDLKLQQI